jgi:O-antigen/teichoic acid export membrane protein
VRPVIPVPPAQAKSTFAADIRRVFVGQVGFAGLAFIGSLLTARLLGPSGRGELSILILVPSLYLVLFEFGQESTYSRLAAEDASHTRALLGNTLAFAGAIVVPSMAVVWVTFVLLGVEDDLLLVSLSAAIAIAGGVYVRALAGLALGLGRVQLYNASRLVLAGGFPTAVLGLALLGVRQPVPYFVAWAFSSLAVGLFLAAAFRHEGATIDVEVGKRAALVALPIHVANVGQFLLLRADQLLLFVIAGSAAVGYYAVAVNIAEVLWYLPAAAGLVSLPFLSGDRPFREKQEALVKAVRLSVWMTGAGAVICAITAPILLPLVFGQDFRPAVVPLLVLLPGILAAAVVRVSTAALVARGSTSRLWRLVIGACVLNILAGVLLIWQFGATGAAAASSLAYCVLGLLLLKAATRVWSLQIRPCLAPPSVLDSLLRRRSSVG